MNMKELIYPYTVRTLDSEEYFWNYRAALKAVNTAVARKTGSNVYLFHRGKIMQKAFSSYKYE